MSVTLQIRRARPGEYAAAGRATYDSYLTDGFLTHADGSHEADYGAELIDATTRAGEAELIVALEDGKALGTVTWCPVGSSYRELAVRPDQGEFRMLAVAPEARGRGVGRRLVQACLDRARAEGASEVVLCSMTTMTAAHGLYRSLGFERAPQLDWEPVPGLLLWGFRLRL